MRPEFVEDGDAVASWEHHIQDDGVRLVCDRELDRLISILRLDYEMTSTLQVDSEDDAHVLVVIDDENLHVPRMRRFVNEALYAHASFAETD